MLYDPQWDVETKANLLTTEALVAWIKTKPADETYPVTSLGNCLIGQYLKYIEWEGDDRLAIAMKSLALGSNHKEFRVIAGIHSPQAMPTFGAALERARSLVP